MDNNKDNAELTYATFLQKAQKGNVETQFLLGSLYESGNILHQDYQEAAKWFDKAAAQGHADAQINLGEIYQHGCGVQKNCQQAIMCYEKAAKQGNAHAQLRVQVLNEMRRACAGWRSIDDDHIVVVFTRNS